MSSFGLSIKISVIQVIYNIPSFVIKNNNMMSDDINEIVDVFLRTNICPPPVKRIETKQATLFSIEAILCFFISLTVQFKKNRKHHNTYVYKIRLNKFNKPRAPCSSASVKPVIRHLSLFVEICSRCVFSTTRTCTDK
jgi:hypothetical protein